MKFNDIVKPDLTFTTPTGKTATVIGVEKDLSSTPVWKNRTEYFVWIVSVKINGDIINLKFGTDDLLKAVKYNHEPPSSWRGRL